MNCRIEASRVKTNWKINEFIFPTHQIYSFSRPIPQRSIFHFRPTNFRFAAQKKNKPPFTLNRSHLERPVFFCSLFTVAASLLIFHDSCVKMILSKSINGPTFNFGFSLWYHLPPSYRKASIFKKKLGKSRKMRNWILCAVLFDFFLWYPANPKTLPYIEKLATNFLFARTK